MEVGCYEFWTLLFREIKNSLFDGSDDRYVPRHGVIALQVPFQIYVYRIAGKFGEYYIWRNGSPLAKFKFGDLNAYHHRHFRIKNLTKVSSIRYLI